MDGETSHPSYGLMGKTVHNILSLIKLVFNMEVKTILALIKQNYLIIIP